MHSASLPQTPTTPKASSFEVPSTVSGTLATLSQASSNNNTPKTTTTTTIHGNKNKTCHPPFTKTPRYPRHHRHRRAPTLRARHNLHPPPSRHRKHHPLSRHRRQQHHHSNFAYLLRPLHPLVSIETGLPHPLFPRTLFAYQLLSHTQLDALAAHYHQLHPSYYSLGYPTAVVGRWWARDEEGSGNGTLQRDQHFEALMMEAKGALGIVEQEEEEGEEDMADGEAKKMVVVEEEECIREAKRRRFGRFIGMVGCESPAREDEGVMSAVMDAWVEGEMDRRMAEEDETQRWREKGAW